MTDVSRALEQIAEIHGHIAKAEVYRGWRSLPVAASGLVGVAAAVFQSTETLPLAPWSFTAYWLVVAVVAGLVGSLELAWRYSAASDLRERARTRQVLAQFLPALAAGLIVSVTLIRLNPALVALLPGLWAMLFGVGIFAARPYLVPAAGWVALYYWTVGLLLLWWTDGVDVLSPWMVGGTFGVGQLLGATALYWSLERR